MIQTNSFSSRAEVANFSHLQIRGATFIAIWGGTQAGGTSLFPVSHRLCSLSIPVSFLPSLYIWTTRSSQTEPLANPSSQSLLLRPRVGCFSHREWLSCLSGLLGNALVILIILMTRRVGSADRGDLPLSPCVITKPVQTCGRCGEEGGYRVSQGP